MNSPIAAHALSCSRDLHLLTMATGVLLSLLTAKTELVVRGVAAYFALRGTMSTIRPEKTLPSLRWLPLCISSSLEAPTTIRRLPSDWLPDRKRAAPRADRSLECAPCFGQYLPRKGKQKSKSVASVARNAIATLPMSRSWSSTCSGTSGAWRRRSMSGRG